MGRSWMSTVLLDTCILLSFWTCTDSRRHRSGECRSSIMQGVNTVIMPWGIIRTGSKINASGDPRVMRLSLINYSCMSAS